MKRRTLRLLAWSYAIKTVLVGILWLVAPEIPQRALDHARRAWSSVTE